MISRCLGLDTSNYTTSAAVFDGEGGLNAGRLLEVPPGALGLRQAEALFQHVKALPERIKQLEKAGLLREIRAVAASARPRAAEGSYMPCFLAGESLGRSLASALGTPFFPVSHQQGHLVAAAWSAGRMELLDAPFLAWHLSGGTTELLRVEPDEGNVRAERIGGTADLAAGQLIDRTGVLLGLDFPCGKALDSLAGTTEEGKFFRVRVKELEFSLSGVENQIKALYERGADRAEVARFALNTIRDAVCRTTEAARKVYPGLPVLCSGGVASNSRLRERMTEVCQAIFAPARYSTDNAMGVAVLAHRLSERAKERTDIS